MQTYPIRIVSKMHIFVPYPTLQFGLGALRGLYLIPHLLPLLRGVSKLSLKALHILNTHKDI